LSKVIDITGQKFGRLTAIKREGSNSDGKALWLCKCDCGNKVIVVGKSIRNGHTKSCGCLSVDRTRSMGKSNLKHGDSKSRLYNVWRGILKRCNNPNNHAYENYGGRGIKICEQWEHSYEKFMKWSFENGYEEGLSIDRIDNDGNYEPSNCRWVTASEQSRNKRDNVLITYKGKTYCMTDWAKIIGINVDTLWRRINEYGFSAKEAVVIGKHKARKNNARALGRHMAKVYVLK